MIPGIGLQRCDRSDPDRGLPPRPPVFLVAADRIEGQRSWRRSGRSRNRVAALLPPGEGLEKGWRRAAVTEPGQPR